MTIKWHRPTEITSIDSSNDTDWQSISWIPVPEMTPTVSQIFGIILRQWKSELMT